MKHQQAGMITPVPSTVRSRTSMMRNGQETRQKLVCDNIIAQGLITMNDLIDDIGEGLATGLRMNTWIM